VISATQKFQYQEVAAVFVLVMLTGVFTQTVSGAVNCAVAIQGTAAIKKQGKIANNNDFIQGRGNKGSTVYAFTWPLRSGTG